VTRCGGPDATVEELSEFYETQFKDDGWTVTHNAKSVENVLIHGKKDDNRYMHVTIMEGDKGGALIMLVTGNE